MTKKKIILIGIVSIIVIFIAFQILKPKEPDFNIETITKGQVLQEVSESGTVQMGENVNLNFKTAGTIESIYVKKGDQVSAGQKIAKLDTVQLSIQLAQAEIAAQAQGARLSELQRGANADLDSYYKNTPDVLNQAFNLADSAVRQQISAMFVYRIEFAAPVYELTYKNCNNIASVGAVSQRKIVENNLNSWRAEIQNLSGDSGSLDKVLLKAEDYLNSIQRLLNILNDTLVLNCQLSLDETAKINAYKPVVTAALTSVNSAISSVSVQKKTIETQKLAVENYSGNNQEITYQQALVKQAEEAVTLLKEQIQDSTLFSPSDGQISQINKRVGELAQPTSPFIVFIPKSPFEISVFIYEEDIVKIEVGNSADINLTAFPDMILKGKVVSVDPAATLIDGVVYFGVKIDLQNPPEGTKTGMSADVTVKTAEKENVLVISGNAVENRDGKYFVFIVENGATTTEREIGIGLKGNNNLLEVTSGLQEGEQVAIPK